MRERESSEFKRNLNGGPLANDGGEQVSINDGRLMITDFVHTENTEGNGWRSASGRCGETAIVINWTAIERKIFFKIAVILQVIAVQEKELVVCGLQLP